MAEDKRQRQQEAADLVGKYAGGGFVTSPDDDVFHSPYSGRPTPVRIDGGVYNTDSPEWKQYMASYDYNRKYKVRDSNKKQFVPKGKVTNPNAQQTQGVTNQGTVNNGGEIAGSTVPQNNQSNTQNQSGTTYDGTDGNGRITVGPQNANLNYYQYGDDSNPNQQGQKGGMNAKYTGEGVSNSYIEYNPDITLADLDPNYLYGENARQQNRKEAGYIARRNDMIASALYNEGKVSREEVANFLSQQNEWMNSTEADRLNTIESVWKRLGQIKPEQPEVDLSKAEDIVQDTSGKLYGKVTAEEGNPKKGIDTLADDNSVLTAMQESRVTTLQDFVSQDVSNIAVQIVEGTMTWREQTWRDAQKYYPEFIAAVNAEVKRQRGQQNVNAIASGGEMNTAAANGQSNANNEIANFGASNATGTKSSVEITKDVHNSLAQNQTANEASETMASIEEDMAILKNRLKNLREEANSKFKGDAPEYMVNAYISNKTQEIQNQMQILEDRYNAAYNRYKTEIAQTQWEKEYQLKQDQLQLERDEFKLKKWATEQGIEIDKAKLNSSNTDKSAKNEGDSFSVTTLSDEQVSQAVDSLYEMFDNGQLGNAQCAAGIQTYYLPMLGITLPSLSSLERKKALINEDENYVPKRGDLIIINSGAKLEDGTPAGHIGIVLGVHKDGTVEYMDWNGKSNEKVAISGININNKSILGFRNVNKGQGQTSGGWTDYDYNRFHQYRDATTESVKQTIADEYRVDIATMNDIVRDALENENKNTVEPDESSDIERTPDDYTNFKNFTDTSNKDISDTDRESIAEMYGFKGNLPGMRKFATKQLANRPEASESDGSIWFKKYENGFNPALTQAFENFGTTKMSDPQFKSLLKTNRLTEEEFGQQRDNYFNYKQVEFDEAGLAILDKIADFQMTMYDKGKVDKDGTMDKNWLWNTWMGGGAAKAAFDAMTNEQLLNKYVQARSSGVTFGSTTEAEWDIMKATNALEKTTGFLSSDEDFTRAYKSYLAGVWEQTMKKPFKNEDWDRYWVGRKNRRDSVTIKSPDEIDDIDINGSNRRAENSTGNGKDILDNVVN